MSSRNINIDIKKIWGEYNPFETDNRKDLDLQTAVGVHSGKRKILPADYKTAYDLFFKKNYQYSQIQELYSELGKWPFYHLLSLSSPDFHIVKNRVGPSKQEHQDNLDKRIAHQKTWNLKNKSVFVLYGPSKDLIDYYDEYYKGRKANSITYPPSLVYRLRYGMKYDVKSMIKEAKRVLKKNIKKDVLDTIILSYPWLVTDQPGSYMIFDTLTKLNKAVGKSVSNANGDIIERGKFAGCMISYDQDPKLRQGSCKSIKEFLKTLPKPDLREHRNKMYFDSYYKGKKITIWTDTFVEMRGPKGKIKLFQQKQNLLKHLSKKIRSVGLVPKADRITQILKDGKFLYPLKTGNKGAGKGNKIYKDAMTGHTFKIVYKPNGYVVGGQKRLGRSAETIDKAIAKGWIEKPTEFTKKQR